MSLGSQVSQIALGHRTIEKAQQITVYSYLALSQSEYNEYLVVTLTDDNTNFVI